MQQVRMPIILCWTLIFAFALMLRCSAAVWWQARQVDENAFAFGDSFSYWVLGHQIYKGEAYQFGGANAKVSRAPGYPLIIAGWHKMFAGSPSLLSVRLLNALLGSLTVIAVGFLAMLMFDRMTGYCAAILAAIYPGAIVMSILILSEGPFCLLMILQLIACHFVIRRINPAAHPTNPGQWIFHDWGPTMLAGVTAGIAILIRPSWMLFTPAFLVVWFLFSRQRKTVAKHGLVMILMLCLTMSPWWVRNYQVTGHFVPTTLQVGASLYDGLHAGATGGSDMSFVLGFHREQNEADSRLVALPADSYEYRLNHRMRQAALSWATAHPGEVMKLAGNKFIRLWRPLPNRTTVQSELHRGGVAGGYLGILGLSVGGLIVLARRSGQPTHSPDSDADISGEISFSNQAPVSVAVLLSISPAIYFTALHMVFVSSIRYRQPAVLVLTVLAGVGLHQMLIRSGLLKRFQANRSSQAEGGC
ncbi:MAG: glycosyltransferase family 39 protein [Planctomycetota bacterium]|nr:glycosyltransferase family 39 protein [Planctomycetota bacterium]